MLNVIAYKLNGLMCNCNERRIFFYYQYFFPSQPVRPGLAAHLILEIIIDILVANIVHEYIMAFTFM